MKNNYYRPSRPEIAHLIPTDKSKILDIGCGQGAFLEEIKTYYSETWGIEVKTKEAKIAKTKVDKILVGKVEDLINEIPDNYFDCITLNDVLEHLLEPTEVLSYLKSKLSKDGILVARLYLAPQ